MRTLFADREHVARELLLARWDPADVLDGFEPTYSRLSRRELDARVRAARAELADCRACPCDCGVDRTVGELGTCNTGRHAIASSAFAHFGEEDCLRGRKVGDDLLRVVQPALRVLPELGHLPAAHGSRV